MTVESAQGATLRAARTHTGPCSGRAEACKRRNNLVEDKTADYLFTAVKDNRFGLFGTLNWGELAGHLCCGGPQARLGRDAHPAGPARAQRRPEPP